MDLAGVDHRAALVHILARHILENRAVRMKADEPVAIEIDQGLATGAHHHITQIGDDDASIAHDPAEQCGAATGGGFDQAAVDDGAGHNAVGCTELVVPVHEVDNIDIQTGGHQTAHLDPGAGAEDHTVGIHDEHLAVGLDAAVDLARQLIEYPVEHRGRGGRLLESDQLVAGHVETRPVDGQGLGLLLDQRGIGVGPLNRATARHHLAAGGPGQHRPRIDERRQQHARNGGGAGSGRQQRPPTVGVLPRTVQHSAYPGMRGCPPASVATPFFLGPWRASLLHRDPARVDPLADQSGISIGNPGLAPRTVNVVTLLEPGNPQN